MIPAVRDPVTAAWQVLSAVMDPEVPVVSVVDLGIVRDITWSSEAGLAVTLTPTYSGCPATEVIETSVREALRDSGFETVVTRLQRAPAWTTDWISSNGRQRLREYGIAPPGRTDPDAGAPIRLVAGVRGLAPTLRPATPPAVDCPRCSGHDTERLSAFGSTACKALYRCRACLEPFEYFKPL